MKERIGSANNKWKLTSDFSDRKLFKEHVSYPRLPKQSLPVRLKSTRDSNDLLCFQTNVLSNHYLSNTQILLALYLNNDLFQCLGGEVFVIARENVDFDSKIAHLFGKLGWEKLEVEYPSSDKFSDSYYLSSEVRNLLVEFCSSVNMKLEPKDIRNDLITLHDFGYITVSEMTFENSEQANEISNLKKKKPRPSLIHIRISPWMLEKSIWRRWKNKYTEKKRTKNFKERALLLLNHDDRLLNQFGFIQDK
ncbi:hypothetical protein DRW07_15445 [Alteromonas sediminis]|uniref:Uncharacterized protein n=1 Tax=Alteromonas sediminis TaxID=2259342 RepID=A0A3N5Y521_9ALTE|nr:hypothetical protein [Alteromonas sediminis]RPJ65299.1 hypothetical protein DRW07_15445 [Alteromonas sediminis]